MEKVCCIIGALIPFVGLLFVGITNWDSYSTEQCFGYLFIQIFLPTLWGLIGYIFGDSFDDDGPIYGP